MKPSEVYERCGVLLHDTDNVRWTTDELRMWLSDGQRAICTFRPDANVESVEIELEEGSIQQLPANAIKLIDITHNVTISGEEHLPGRAITITDREEMDRFDVTWRTSRKAKTVQQFMHDATNPKVFYTYPPNNGEGLVSADISVMPDVLEEADDDTELPLGNEWNEALLNFVMAKAYAKDGEFVSRSGEYMGLFIASVQGEQTAAKAYQPNVTKAGGKPDLLAQQTGGV